MVPWSFDAEKSREDFAKLIIAHEYPFNSVNHHFLKVFLKGLQPEFKLYSRNTVRGDCVRIYGDEKKNLETLLGKLDCKVSFTSDLWSSGSKAFMSLTGHFVDKSWKLRKRILCFTPLPFPHTGYNLAQAIHEKLVEWNLKFNNRTNFANIYNL